MTSSLVGSEMCIRDSLVITQELWVGIFLAGLSKGLVWPVLSLTLLVPVSYTHLTLPTICSV
eukprot:7325657-Prorocentrum_lima.AAC.1